MRSMKKTQSFKTSITQNINIKPVDEALIKLKGDLIWKANQGPLCGSVKFTKKGCHSWRMRLRQKIKRSVQEKENERVT